MKRTSTLIWVLLSSTISLSYRKSETSSPNPQEKPDSKEFKIEKSFITPGELTEIHYIDGTYTKEETIIIDLSTIQRDAQLKKTVTKIDLTGDPVTESKQFEQEISQFIAENADLSSGEKKERADLQLEFTRIFNQLDNREKLHVENPIPTSISVSVLLQ